MADVVSKSKRSQMMSGIKGKNTKPEISLRKELFSRGFRYRTHGRILPGKPDLVFKKYNALVFVNGCFWHGHENCKLFRMPKSRIDFWEEKIGVNIDRDKRNIIELLDFGWRVLIVWECSIKGKSVRLPATADLVQEWLLSDRKGLFEIRLDNDTQLPIFKS
ncbi:MAG: DNA mismatch endonuclease Vsr [Alphaproteobacteria bacterium]|nr:DNA mismatch endonuclease Vsr [Alphaproteobacteria bacterium]NCQ87369.1 DNA mismatch endonuclease Vsr [Alphaproteobacteria bacterium]NCT06240.1 DNA mismatch endonuclease Vsr [Alphaproteobacteria bacterium]